MPTAERDRPDPAPPRTVVALGEAMLRLTAAPGQRLRAAHTLESHVAGAEANVAVALAHLGVPVALVSALPANPLGDRVADELAGAGVDLSFVERPHEGRLGLFFVEQGAAPRPTRVWYDRANSAFARMGDLDAGAFARAGHAVVSGITPALGSGTRRLAETFVTQAREAGARVCVDVNYRALLWKPDVARRGLSELLAGADLVVCSRRDVELVFGVSGGETEAALAFAEAWAPRAALVVITLGEHGCVAVAENEILEQPAFPATVVDRFGVGDAFFAGLLWGLWRGDGHAAALRAAAMLASLKCTVRGDLAQFSSEELSAALCTTPDGAIVR